MGDVSIDALTHCCCCCGCLTRTGVASTTCMPTAGSRPLHGKDDLVVGAPDAVVQVRYRYARACTSVGVVVCVCSVCARIDATMNACLCTTPHSARGSAFAWPCHLQMMVRGWDHERVKRPSMDEIAAVIEEEYERIEERYYKDSSKGKAGGTKEKKRGHGARLDFD